jgi:DNA-binding IclR family transcriptional regulator
VKPNVKRFALLVVLWFARNPDEELLTTDISARFGVPRDDVWRLLRGLRREGWLEMQLARQRYAPATWRAGPRLRQEIRL